MNRFVTDLRARTDLRCQAEQKQAQITAFSFAKRAQVPGKAWTQKFNQWLNAIEWKDDLLKATADCYHFKIQTLQSDLHEMDPEKSRSYLSLENTQVL